MEQFNSTRWSTKVKHWFCFRTNCNLMKHNNNNIIINLEIPSLKHSFFKRVNFSRLPAILALFYIHDFSRNIYLICTLPQREAHYRQFNTNEDSAEMVKDSMSVVPMHTNADNKKKKKTLPGPLVQRTTYYLHDLKNY